MRLISQLIFSMEKECTMNTNHEYKINKVHKEPDDSCRCDESKPCIPYNQFTQAENINNMR